MPNLVVLSKFTNQTLSDCANIYVIKHSILKLSYCNENTNHILHCTYMPECPACSFVDKGISWKTCMVLDCITP